MDLSLNYLTTSTTPFCFLLTLLGAGIHWRESVCVGRTGQNFPSGGRKEKGETTRGDGNYLGDSPDAPSGRQVTTFSQAHWSDKFKQALLLLINWEGTWKQFDCLRVRTRCMSKFRYNRRIIVIAYLRKNDERYNT